MELLLVHLAATWFLAGLIWVIQLVHYPLFDAVDRGGFSSFEAEHSKRITWIVAPAMALEALSAAALVFLRPAGAPFSLVLLGAVLLAVVWGSTAFIQVPCHQRLSGGYDAAAHRRLVSSNWIRTAAWSLRALIAAQLVLQAAAA